MKPYRDWGEDELRFLIDNKSSETIEREYKETFSIERDSDKKELCKDVSAMANSQGGVVVFGLRETKREGMGSIPESLQPISDLNLKERAQQILLDGVKPRMEFKFHSFPSSDGSGEYVLVEIPKSLRGLHMVTVAKENRYYIRRDYQAVPMTPYEIEEAYRNYFSIDKTLTTQLEKYRLSNPNSSLSHPLDAWFSVTTVSYFGSKDMFSYLCFEDYHRLSQKAKGMRTGDDEWFAGNRFRSHYFGLASEYKDNERYEHKHVIYRDGAVYLGLVADLRRREKPSIYSADIILLLHNSIAFSIGLMEDAGYLGAVRILVSLERLEGFALSRGSFRGDNEFPVPNFEHVIDTTVREAIESIPRVIEPLLHHLWQSFGYQRCFLIGEDGRYIESFLQEMKFFE